MKMDLRPVKYEVPLPGASAPLKTFLRRFGQRTKGAPAVVLLHGGNTSGDTFLKPDPGLVGYLVARGFDVWVLEWRSSPHILKPLLKPGSLPLGGTTIKEVRLFTLDHVVEEELPTALEIVRHEIGGKAPLSLLGHCFGSGVVSMAIARGRLEAFAVDAVVLSTLGLFMEVPWHGWIKAEDFLMERVLVEDPQCRGVDPHNLDSWPGAMRETYASWPAAWLPADGEGEVGMLRRLSFMFGQPYSIDRLHPSLRTPDIEQFFGPMHVGLFLHASQMVRRGYSAAFDQPDVVDRARLRQAPGHAQVKGDLDPTFFREKRVTLITAGKNQLWHRDSMDLMYEWLRASCPPRQPPLHTKRVFAEYNLQELLWGMNASEEVFPAIELGLARVPGYRRKGPGAMTAGNGGHGDQHAVRAPRAGEPPLEGPAPSAGVERGADFDAVALPPGTART